MDQLYAMEVFLAVAQQRSFTAAGTQLGLTRAMVSKQVMQLEQRLGVRLLHRSTRDVSLTDAGQSYLEPCRATLTQAREASQAVTQRAEDLTGPISIQAPTSFGAMWLAQAVAQFCLLHPRLSPTVTVDDALLDPIKYGFDLSIRVGGIPNIAALAMRPLAPCKGLLYASPDYLARHGTPRFPPELAQHQCLQFSHLTDGTTWRFRCGEVSQEVRVTPRLTSNNGLVLHQAALAGLGIAYNTTFLAWRDLLDGRLVPVLPDWSLPLNHLTALYPASRQLSPKVRALIDFLVICYQPEPPWDAALCGGLGALSA